MEPPLGIETDRLVLRRTVANDADGVFAYASDAEVTRFLTITPRTDITDSVEFLERCDAAWNAGTSFPLAMVDKSTGGFIGMMELRVSIHGIELGFARLRSVWGKGYMTEAIQAVVDWGFGDDDVYRVWAYVDVGNVASRRALEKAGMTREGRLHRWQIHPNSSPEPADVYVYAVWRHDTADWRRWSGRREGPTRLRVKAP
jgi:RimJ/RimL family protein N-acetyltransferase